MTTVAVEEKIEIIPMDQIDDNPFQPRTHYSTKAIDELAGSIDQIGMRQIPEARRIDGRVQMAYGHLRKRAVAKLCKKKPKKWTGMPVRIKDLTDDEMFYFAIEENLRRRDITPIEVARSIETFFTRYPGKKVTEVAQKLSMTQGNVSNLRRVLTLPEKVLDKIEEDRINFTMGRELLVLQGRNSERNKHDYTQNKPVKEVVTDEEMMLSAIGYIINPESANSRYLDCSKTVNGMKKAIYHVVNSHFHRLFQRMDYYGGRGDDPLFDQVKAGCAKCEHMIKAYETTNQARPFCTNAECWEKLQEKHRKAAAAASAKKAEEEIRKRIQETPPEPDTAETESISQEMPDAVSETIGTVDETIRGVDETPDIVDETPGAVDETGGPTLAETFAKEREKAEKVPKALSEQATQAAGTRAVIIDIEDIRSGPYGLKDGHVQLEQELGIMHDTAECLERCTTGFHYAFDSRHPERRAEEMYICTNPRCVGKKKAAYTREKNAAGTAKKKAEMSAIKRAVEETGKALDKPRLLLIIQSQIDGNHVDGGNSWRTFQPAIWWWKKVMGEEYKLEYRHRHDEIYKSAAKKSEEDLARLIVDFMLQALAYQGEVLHYKIKTTDALSRMKIGINIDGKTGDKEEDK